LAARARAGLITGAADDDPSGIVTCSQAGAAFGYALAWSVVLTLPFTVAVQEISARLGRVTGSALSAALKRHPPAPALAALVGLLVIANVINLGADIGAMAAVTTLLVGGLQCVHDLRRLCVRAAVLENGARPLPFRTLSAKTMMPVIADQQGGLPCRCRLSATSGSVLPT
jgi:hypothetical protein